MKPRRRTPLFPAIAPCGWLAIGAACAASVLFGFLLPR